MHLREDEKTVKCLSNASKKRYDVIALCIDQSIRAVH